MTPFAKLRAKLRELRAMTDADLAQELRDAWAADIYTDAPEMADSVACHLVTIREAANRLERR